MGNPQTIDLNGNTYDATTGRLIKSNPDKKPGHEGHRADHYHKSVLPKTIDGVIGIIKNPENRLSLKPIKQNNGPRPHKVASSASRATEHSKTLMRKIVAKPSAKNKVRKDPDVAPRHDQRFTDSIANKIPSPLPIAKEIANRAQQIQKNPLVERFSNSVSQKFQVDKTAQTKADTDVYEKRLEKLNAIDKQPTSENNLNTLTMNALEKADSFRPLEHKVTHAHAKLAHKLNLKPGALLVGILIIVIVVIAGIFTYVNYDSLALYVDERGLGIKTSLPSYVQPGFRLTKLSRDGLYITFNYKSNSDTRKYQLVEGSSTWDSQSLVDLVIQPEAGPNYNTDDINGRVVYLFNNKAAWVDGFVYYSLTNNANLTVNQITQIINGT